MTSSRKASRPYMSTRSVTTSSVVFVSSIPCAVQLAPIEPLEGDILMYVLVLVAVNVADTVVKST